MDLIDYIHKNSSAFGLIGSKFVIEINDISREGVHIELRPLSTKEEILEVVINRDNQIITKKYISK